MLAPRKKAILVPLTLLATVTSLWWFSRAGQASRPAAETPARVAPVVEPAPARGDETPLA
jgi:hypothetical protein